MQVQGEGTYRDGEGLERHVVRSGCNLWPWVAMAAIQALLKTMVKNTEEFPEGASNE